MDPTDKLTKLLKTKDFMHNIQRLNNDKSHHWHLNKHCYKSKDKKWLPKPTLFASFTIRIDEWRK